MIAESDSDAPKPHKSIKKSVRFSVGHPDSDDERDASPEIQGKKEKNVLIFSLLLFHSSNAWIAQWCSSFLSIVLKILRNCYYAILLNKVAENSCCVD